MKFSIKRVLRIILVLSCSGVTHIQPTSEFDRIVDLYIMRKKTEALKLKAAQRLEILKNGYFTKKQSELPKPKLKKKSVTFNLSP